VIAAYVITFRSHAKGLSMKRMNILAMTLLAAALERTEGVAAVRKVG